MIQLTPEQFIEQYRPISIHDVTDMGETLLRQSHADACNWTVLNGDDGFYITNGWAYVNREMFIITELPWEGTEAPHGQQEIDAYDIEINEPYDLIDTLITSGATS